jgi:hypothetical protein
MKPEERPQEVKSHRSGCRTRDYRDLWINPEDPGAHESPNRGLADRTRFFGFSRLSREARIL